MQSQREHNGGGKMNGLAYVLLALVAILIIVGIIAALVWRKRREEKPGEVDFRVFFILGFCWFPLGVVFMVVEIPIGFVFFALGLVYLAIGLANRDKWKKG